MIVSPQVPLHRLILSLSEALDNVSPFVSDHQLRVAYISIKMARFQGFSKQELMAIFNAAALHDIGLIRPVNRVQAVAYNRLENIGWHGEIGYELLKGNNLTAEAAPIVRYHHAVWREQYAENHPKSIPRASFIIGLADEVDRMIQRDIPILYQHENIRETIFKGKGKIFCPDCVDAFMEASSRPAFWLDVTSKQIYSILIREIDWPTLTIDEETIEGISEIFARIVDSLSHWTATHTAGVAATAVALAKKLNFSPREQSRIKAAGNLHDLGKITVPSHILDSPNGLMGEEKAILEGHPYHTFRILETIGGMGQIAEWAAFHHEHLDGRGYPFGHGAKDLTLGSRIMAVADIFTALAEDRPYRQGMDEISIKKMMHKMAQGRAIDADVCDVLASSYREIKEIQHEAQAAYSITQRYLIRIMQNLDIKEAADSDLQLAG